jgi:hypothetical protein
MKFNMMFHYFDISSPDKSGFSIYSKFYGSKKCLSQQHCPRGDSSEWDGKGTASPWSSNPLLHHSNSSPLHHSTFSITNVKLLCIPPELSGGIFFSEL